MNADRREIAQDDFGLGYCNITKCCTEVCPENIKITDNALIPMKERVMSRKYDPLVWLGSKISRRPRQDTPAVPGKKNEPCLPNARAGRLPPAWRAALGSGERSAPPGGTRRDHDFAVARTHCR